MTDIVLAAGQVWVPTKGRSKGREITWVQGPHIEWHNSQRTGTWRADIRAGQTEDFRAWIARTGAVLQEDRS